MAQVPNYYFQSPWIADAARNLASALAPPDPEKILANKRAQFEFERAQEIAGYQREDRENKIKADDSIAKIFKLQSSPVVNPLTGEVDEAETERQVLSALSDAIDVGGLPYVAPGSEAAGPAAPQFTAKQILKQMQLTSAGQLLAQRYGFMGDMLATREAGMNFRQERGHGYNIDRDNNNYKNRLALEAERHEHRIAEKRAGAAGGKPPRMLSRAVFEDLLYQIDLKESMNPDGKTIPPYYKDKLVEEVEEIVQAGGKVQTAVNAVWRKHGLDVTAPPKKKRGLLAGLFGGDEEDSYIIPKGYENSPDAAPAVDPNSLGGAAIGAGIAPAAAPASAVAAPTVTSAPAESTPPARVLKEGVPRRFPANGQVWELQNGVPTRRRDLE